MKQVRSKDEASPYIGCLVFLTLVFWCAWAVVAVSFEIDGFILQAGVGSLSLGIMLVCSVPLFRIPSRQRIPIELVWVNFCESMIIQNKKRVTKIAVQKKLIMLDLVLFLTLCEDHIRIEHLFILMKICKSWLNIVNTLPWFRNYIILKSLPTAFPCERSGYGFSFIPRFACLDAVEPFGLTPYYTGYYRRGRWKISSYRRYVYKYLSFVPPYGPLAYYFKMNRKELVVAHETLIRRLHQEVKELLSIKRGDIKRRRIKVYNTWLLCQRFLLRDNRELWIRKAWKPKVETRKYVK